MKSVLFLIKKWNFYKTKKNKSLVIFVVQLKVGHKWFSSFFYFLIIRE
jgi:hypothetical protein